MCMPLLGTLSCLASELCCTHTLALPIVFLWMMHAELVSLLGVEQSDPRPGFMSWCLIKSPNAADRICQNRCSSEQTCAQGNKPLLMDRVSYCAHNWCCRRGGALRLHPTHPPRLRCRWRGLPGSTAADISEAPPCTFFLSPYNRISHWREKRTVWLACYTLWGGPCARFRLSPGVFFFWFGFVFVLVVAFSAFKNNKISNAESTGRAESTHLCIQETTREAFWIIRLISAHRGHLALWLPGEEDCQCPESRCWISRRAGEWFLF